MTNTDFGWDSTNPKAAVRNLGFDSMGAVSTTAPQTAYEGGIGGGPPGQLTAPLENAINTSNNSESHPWPGDPGLAARGI